jgi:hypothetical protein
MFRAVCIKIDSLYFTGMKGCRKNTAPVGRVVTGRHRLEQRGAEYRGQDQGHHHDGRIEALALNSRGPAELAGGDLHVVSLQNINLK